jgi:hypothetical protein
VDVEEGVRVPVDGVDGIGGAAAVEGDDWGGAGFVGWKCSSRKRACSAKSFA